MAEDGRVTPEKQLLNLIESKGAKGADLKKAQLKQAGKSLLSLGALRGVLFGRFSFFKRGAGKKVAGTRRRIDIALVNRSLATIAICLLVYVAGDTVAAAINLQRPPNFAFQNEKSVPASFDKIRPLKEASYYQQKIQSRDIFQEGGRPKKKLDTPAPAAQAENTVISSLSLVGISWSSNPDVIIEDKSKQRTFFVKRGQMVVDGVKVEAVFKDHVILNYDGQEFELR